MNKETSVIVRTAAGVLAVPVLVFGAYVILHGHLTPGGGFAGGAVMATFTALLLVAGGGRLGKDAFCAAESIGLVAFAVLAFFGLGRTFFYNFLANTGELFGTSVAFGPNAGSLGTAGVLPLMNMAIGLEVFAALSVIMMLIFRYRGDDDA